MALTRRNRNTSVTLLEPPIVVERVNLMYALKASFVGADDLYHLCVSAISNGFLNSPRSTDFNNSYRCGFSIVWLTRIGAVECYLKLRTRII